jgi:1-acyl-sn-glycerol-3-phosphate acyltransferase
MTIRHRPAWQRALGRGLLRLTGWRVEGHPTTEPRSVLVAYPHTTNWDFACMMVAEWALGFRAQFIAKESLFRFPLGGLMRSCGGLPVQRNHAQGQVAAVASLMRASDEIMLVLAPEGTRSLRPGWRTGFYRIAEQAGAPLQLGYVDYDRKVVGFGPLVWPTGDLERDFAEMRAYYASVGCRGRFPQQASPVQPLPAEQKS